MPTTLPRPARPSWYAAHDVGRVDQQVDALLGNREANLVAIADRRQWPANGRFGRDVQDDGAERRAGGRGRRAAPLKLHQVKLTLTVVIAPGLHGLLSA